LSYMHGIKRNCRDQRSRKQPKEHTLTCRLRKDLADEHMEPWKRHLEKDNHIAWNAMIKLNVKTCILESNAIKWYLACWSHSPRVRSGGGLSEQLSATKFSKFS